MHVAVDIGGTFTDLVVMFEDGKVKGYKTPSTRPDLTEGLFNGLDLIARDHDMSASELMHRLLRLDFGTTAATNALLEGKAARTGLLITKGFRDTLLIREGGKSDSYDMKAVYPSPYIPRSLTFEVDERMTAEGDVLRPLDERSVHDAIGKLREMEVEAVVISLIWAIANAEHELRVAELVRRQLPNVAVSLGHEVNPCIREYRRTIAAAIDASLKPLVAHNLRLMDKKLTERNFRGKLSYITSTGGKASGDDIRKRPVYLCFSGPSAAPESGRRFAEMEGFTSGNIITVDMGGTSFDVSVTTGGQLPMHREGIIGGLPFGVPSVEIHSIGSGGGSIARVDSGGFVHVGPESAGAKPGPACYQRGGERPTVTDANLVAGYLNDAFAAGSGMRLSRSSAENAIRREISGPLNIPLDEAASLVTLACEQNMVAAIDDITIKRGVDPRGYVMVAGGAAAGAHAESIAREIGIKTVIIPKMAGVLSAFGILAGEVSFGFARSLYVSTDKFDAHRVRQTVDELTNDANAFLDKMEVAPGQRQLLFSCEARYRGQVWQITLPFTRADVAIDDVAGQLRRMFNRLHKELYATSSDDDVVEMTEWNVQARGQVADVKLPQLQQGEVRGPIGSRRVYFKETRSTIDTPVYGPASLEIGQFIRGPLLVDEQLTTIVVSPATRILLSPLGNYIVELD